MEDDCLDQIRAIVLGSAVRSVPNGCPVGCAKSTGTPVPRLETKRGLDGSQHVTAPAAGQRRRPGPCISRRWPGIVIPFPELRVVIPPSQPPSNLVAQLPPRIASNIAISGTYESTICVSSTDPRKPTHPAQARWKKSASGSSAVRSGSTASGLAMLASTRPAVLYVLPFFYRDIPTFCNNPLPRSLARAPAPKPSSS